LPFVFWGALQKGGEMAECPAEFDLRIALGSMRCRNCGFQCMIKEIVKELNTLKEQMAKIKPA
jgi:DNA-directed RNA polymerase subunit RPC12/RpoP